MSLVNDANVALCFVYNFPMTKKALIVVNAYEVLPPIQKLIERLKAELSLFEIEVDVRNTGDILAWVGKDGWVYHWDLPYDFGIYLDKDPYASILLEKSGLRLFNSSEAVRLCDDKMATYCALAHQGIKMPITISGPLRYSKKENTEFLNNVMGKLKFPMIAKLNYGSRGEGVFLINDEKELKAFEDKHSYEPRLYQEFIASSKGMDYRIIVIGGKAIAAMKREAGPNDFRSNIGAGGKATSIALPPYYYDLAEKAAKLLKLDYCGVDLLKGPMGEPLLCEVNSNAFLEGIEKATGLNIAWVYAYYICHEIYK